MLRIPRVEVVEPTTIDEALALLAQHGDDARVLAGGTDLLPNLKHEVETPKVVIGLWRLDALRAVHATEAALHLGPLATLASLARDPRVAETSPALVDALSQIAGPQLRSMGTIGGNVCLDTRCQFINQTYFWRHALGFCLKKDGTVCHVVAGGRRCVAAASNDSAPVLMTLGATLVLRSAEGTRVVPIDSFYVANGQMNQDRRRTELLTEIVVPRPAPGTIGAYVKLRTRAAIDFPELGVAVRARLGAGDLLEDVDVVLTALAARPLRVPQLARFVGRPLDACTIAELGEAAYTRAHPLTNLATDPAYRREMVPVFVRRAFERALTRREGGRRDGAGAAAEVSA
jgi:4-hydroxybenzoyl-CoA reductase subunit beta